MKYTPGSSSPDGSESSQQRCSCGGYRLGSPASALVSLFLVHEKLRARASSQCCRAAWFKSSKACGRHSQKLRDSTGLQLSKRALRHRRIPNMIPANKLLLKRLMLDRRLATEGSFRVRIYNVVNLYNNLKENVFIPLGMLLLTGVVSNYYNRE